jgi:hypothetical protein
MFNRSYEFAVKEASGVFLRAKSVIRAMLQVAILPYYQLVEVCPRHKIVLPSHSLCPVSQYTEIKILKNQGDIDGNVD